MRIIAGKYKGKVLKEFVLSSTRPTADMVREALFDKLGYTTVDCVFLDLFAGTGAVGIEALSRGAKECYFVDKNLEAIKIIKNNLSLINTKNGLVFNYDFKTALSKFAKNNIKFNIIFLDPPYATNCAEEAISYINSHELLRENGMIIWEHDVEKIDYIATNFADYQTRKYGKKYLTYLYNIK